ncbi:MAG: hypothetical protein GY710_05580 [Desulfobacteraceae bacterium]|nr:hypothetical protein [Desulfobacteraceae bacterium]
MGIFNRFKDKSEKTQKSMIKKRLDELKTELETNAAGEVLDKVLYGLLEAMALLFVINREYRKNIKDFKASYVIRSEDGKIDVTAVFKKISLPFTQIDGMDVKDTAIANPTTTVTFKDGKAMADFLLSGNPDVIEGLLDNQLSVSGNLNYLFKFIYLLWLIPEILGISDLKKMLLTPA